MFTGIVEEMDACKGGTCPGGGANIAARMILDDLKIGDSVAVNGSV